jgi:NADH-quinone oxidoreductase subunit L
MLAILAAVTMVYAALLAFAQTDFKRMLAYSTLSQIAIMLSALAAAPADVGPVPAVSHLIGHAFFKALLFLAAGWLSVLVGATALSAMRGRLHTARNLRWPIGIGLASLAGVPPLIGFFTKDTVIDTAIEGASDGGGLRAWIVVVALFVTVVLTAAYCTRAWLLLDTPLDRPVAADGTAVDGKDGAGEALVSGAGAPEGLAADGLAVDGLAAEVPPEVAPAAVLVSADDAEVERVREHGHTPITLPAALVVAVLAALCVVGTLFLTSLRGAIHIGLLSALLSVLLIIGAAYAVWAVSDRGRRDAVEPVPVRVRDAAVRGFGVDTAYVAVGRAVTAVARLVVVLDRDVVDAYPRAAAVVTRAAGRAGQRSHRAVPSLSLVALLSGVVVVAVLGVAAWRCP